MKYTAAPPAIAYLEPGDKPDIPYITELVAQRLTGILNNLGVATAAAQTAPVGAAPPVGTYLGRRTWVATLTTDAAGVASAAMPAAAPNGIVGVHIGLVEPAGGAGPNVRVDWRPTGSTLATLSFRAVFSASAVNYANSAVTVTITAVYW